MNTDIYETAEAYEFLMDLPGCKKEDIRIEMKDGYLFVEALRTKDAEENGRKYIRRESFQGPTARRFYLGEEVNEKKSTARFEDGVLMLYVPKKQPAEEEEKSTMIPVL